MSDVTRQDIETLHASLAKMSEDWGKKFDSVSKNMGDINTAMGILNTSVTINHGYQQKKIESIEAQTQKNTDDLQSIRDWKSRQKGALYMVSLFVGAVTACVAVLFSKIAERFF